MDEPLAFFNIVGWLGVVIGLAGIFTILKASFRMAGKLRAAMNLLIISLVCFIASGISTGILTVKYNTPYVFGYIIVPLFFIGMSSIVLGGKILLDVLEKISGGKNKK